MSRWLALLLVGAVGCSHTLPPIPPIPPVYTSTTPACVPQGVPASGDYSRREQRIWRSAARATCLARVRTAERDAARSYANDLRADLTQSRERDQAVHADIIAEQRWAPWVKAAIATGSFLIGVGAGVWLGKLAASFSN